MTDNRAGVAGPPVVSVAMLAFNHERYLAQAIASVLAQEVDVPIEIVIGEDCSTDRTRKILADYAVRHPNIIRPLLRASNIGMHANAAEVLQACRGEFVALLEGDDYWTDPMKLRIQLELLRSDPSLVGSYHQVLNMPDAEPSVKQSLSAPCSRADYRLSFDDLLEACTIPTGSVLFRRAAWDGYPAWLADLSGGDWGIFLLLARSGDFGYVARPMGVYRQHSAGAWTGLSRRRRVENAARCYLAFRATFGPGTAVSLRRGLYDNLSRSVRHMESCGDPPVEVRRALLRVLVSGARLGRWPTPRDLWWWARLRLPRCHDFFFRAFRDPLSRRGRT